MTPHPQHETLSVESARVIGDDLIRALEPACGDPAAVDAIANRYVDVLGDLNFALVCMVVVQTTYAECLIPTHQTPLPHGRLALVAPDERKHA